MVSFFDVKSLFTNVTLDRTIQLILKRIYEKHEASTKHEMKKMLILCSKYVHFTLNKEIYKQTYGVA